MPVALQDGEHLEADYRTIDPQGLVPVYSDPQILLSQSLAIIEYLD
ncbi:MAG: glutathione S-transferase N-terminal domain-containing protein [Bacteroidetes bacterium]|nr:glutathione S-transferase N-terminal domain-containing protein [Bacteroidota bacterium]